VSIHSVRRISDPPRVVASPNTTPLTQWAVLEGLYGKARRGELKNFTGIDSPYESPDAPEIHLKSAVNAAEECVQQVLAKLI